MNEVRRFKVRVHRAPPREGTPRWWNERRLDFLLDKGFSRNHVAQMLHVRPALLRDWTSNDPKSESVPSEVKFLNKLIMLCQELEEMGFDCAQWFESRIHMDSYVTPVHLFTKSPELCITYAFGCDVTVVLNSYDREWRINGTSEYEIFTAEDGFLSMRKKP